MRQLRALLRFLWNHPLSKQNKISAMARLARWQFGVRLLPYPIVLPFIEESVLVVERSMTGATGNYYSGLHEFEDMAFLLHLLRPEDLFLDVGANVGSYTVLASKVIGATTIAAEPIPSTYRNLERNIHANRIQERVTSLNVGLGKDVSKLTMSNDRDTMNSIVEDNYQGAKIDVEILPVDDVLNGKEAVLWKVDVEGFEEAVIQGAGRSLSNPKLLAVMLESNSEWIEAKMTAVGFQLHQYEPFSRSLTPVQAKSKNSANRLWIKDAGQAIARLKAARQITIHGVTF